MRIIICDDNKAELELYSDMIKALAEKHRIPVNIELFQSGESALFRMEDKDKPVDIIYLDIIMPGTNGMETAKRLRCEEYDYNGELVFLTGSKDYAIDGYDVSAFHYIVKGETTAKKFESIFLGVVKKAQKKHSSFLRLKGIGEYRNINIDDISYFEVMRKVITVHYGQGKTFEFYSTFDKLEALVFPLKFMRVHRSYIVNMSHVSKLNGHELTLFDDSVIPVGRTYYDDLKTAFDGVNM